MLPNSSITETMTPARDTISHVLSLPPKHYLDRLLAKQRGPRGRMPLQAIKPLSKRARLAGLAIKGQIFGDGRLRMSKGDFLELLGISERTLTRIGSELWRGDDRVFDLAIISEASESRRTIYELRLRKARAHWLRAAEDDIETSDATDASGKLLEGDFGGSTPDKNGGTPVRNGGTSAKNGVRSNNEDLHTEITHNTQRERPPQKAAAPSLCFKDLSEPQRKELQEVARETCLSERRDLDSRHVLTKFVDHHTAEGTRLSWLAWQARLRNWIRNERTDPRDVASPRQHDGTSPMKLPRQPSGMAQLEQAAEAEIVAKRKAMWGRHHDEEATSETVDDEAFEQTKLRKGAGGIGKSWPWLLDALKAEKEPRDAFDRCFHEWEATARGREFDNQDEAAADFETFARGWIQERAEARKMIAEVRNRILGENRSA